jgi:peptidoglycan/LPS O-acetylase OafA/YrhL
MKRKQIWMDMATERKVFTSLDGIRGVAAIAVVFRHVTDRTLALWLPGSYLAVDLFFVLSGFVLAHSYLMRLRSNMGALRFMRLRLIRLYPLYLLGTLMAIPFVYRALQHDNAPGIFTTLAECAAFAALFLPLLGNNTLGSSPFPLNHPAWSLFFELLINFAFALLAKRLTTRVLWIILAFGLAVLAVTSLYFHGLDVGWQSATLAGGLSRVIFSFFAGVGVYHAWRSGILHWIKLPMPVAAFLLVCVFALEPSHGRALYDFVIASVLFPALVLGLARHEPGPALAPICSALGHASYGIYVLQVAAIYVGSSLIKRVLGYQPTDHGVLISILLVCFTITCAVVADRIFDVPVRTALKKRLKSPMDEPLQSSTLLGKRVGPAR